MLITFSAFILISGCTEHRKFDTSKLEVVDATNTSEIDENIKKEQPIDYEAPSLKIAIESLPYDLKLPEKLPFETEGFRVNSLQDLNKEGKKGNIIRIHLMAVSKDKSNPKIVDILVQNQKIEVNGANEVELKNNLHGYIAGTTIFVYKDGISYLIGIMGHDAKKIEKALIDLANQI
ncbi:MAG: hypothetical protein K0S51_1109 [Bacillales bacterium]|jgi:hypothetical protein|nr:hypothetical protein [Bacillales bacterium]